MANAYEVGDKVKLLLTTYIDEEPVESYWAGKIITYYNTAEEGQTEDYLYTVSVDGMGGVIFAKEGTVGGDPGLVPVNP